jgi:hypothetical protein
MIVIQMALAGEIRGEWLRKMDIISRLPVNVSVSWLLLETILVLS